MLMNNNCFSKQSFDSLKENEKEEYLKNNMFFCSSCNNIFNLYLIKINEEYDNNKTYFNIIHCNYHRYCRYPKWYS